MTIWVVPGAPLPNGEGWRIWYSWEGDPGFAPAPVDVRSLGDAPETTTRSWHTVTPPKGLARNIGLLTVRLALRNPGAQYKINIPEAELKNPLVWPSMRDKGNVNFLLASCFWRNADKEGRYATALRNLIELEKPAFKLLAGDQVYLDFPLALNFDSATEFTADRYGEYWADKAYRDALLTCPNFFMCDDHEFWNNYPEVQGHLSRTRTPERRKAWGDAAADFYRAFQMSCNGSPTPWYRFDAGGVSFFVADTRSEREAYSEDEDRHFFLPSQWAALEHWATHLTGPGVLVLGQPVFQEKGGSNDYSLWDFEADYARLLALIEDAMKPSQVDGKAHDVLILSGDIHTGRYVEATALDLKDKTVREFIASPSSAIVWGIGHWSPSKAPGEIKATHRGRPINWKLKTGADNKPVEFGTNKNNIALIRLSEGRGKTIRFELSLWPIDKGANQTLFERAIELE